MTYLANLFADPNLILLKIWVGKILLILLTLVLAKVAMSLGYLIVERAFRLKTLPGRHPFDERRANTLKTILKSVLSYAIYFIAAITIMDELNVPVAAVLSAAGILGLAVGFGAQSLVKDVITGFFIIFEDQFSVGEYIETEGVGGVVEDVGLRVTRLRDWGGQLHIIPNGKISMVTNHNRGNMRALVEVSVSYEENIDRVLDILRQVTVRMAEDYKGILREGPQVLGIWKMADSEVGIRIVARTKPMEQWGIEMELRKRIKEAFDREGIKVPYLHGIYITADKDKKMAEGAAGGGTE